MTDFYALLKQSILDRGIKDSTDREEIYAQARRAVVKQLWDFRPPLAADEIDQRVGVYDRAVERIETELKVVFNSSTPAKAKAKVIPAKSKKAMPAAAPAPTARFVVNGHAQSAALAEWAREQPEYAPGVQRSANGYAPPATLPKRAPPPPPPPEPEDELDEEPYDDLPIAYEDEPEEAHPASPPPRAQPIRRSKDRWIEPARRIEPAQPMAMPDWLSWLGTGEQVKVRLLAIAIGALFVVLVGVVAYWLGARSHEGVTLPIGVRHEVSDAATAARIPTAKADITQSFAVFDGQDPTIFSTTPDNPIQFDSANGFARVSSSAGAAGVKVLIGPGLAARLAGHDVRIVITARSSAESGAAGMRFAYQSGLAISHWQTANLSSDYQQLGMQWRVPTMRTSPTGDLLLIEPGIPGDGTGADIKAIRIDVLAET